MVAGVAELVDARDSKSRDFGHVGSSPTSGTKFFSVALSFFGFYLKQNTVLLVEFLIKVCPP